MPGGRGEDPRQAGTAGRVIGQPTMVHAGVVEGWRVVLRANHQGKDEPARQATGKVGIELPRQRVTGQGDAKPRAAGDRGIEQMPKGFSPASPPDGFEVLDDDHLRGGESGPHPIPGIGRFSGGDVPPQVGPMLERHRFPAGRRPGRELAEERGAATRRDDAQGIDPAGRSTIDEHLERPPELTAPERGGLEASASAGSGHGAIH